MAVDQMEPGDECGGSVGLPDDVKPLECVPERPLSAFNADELFAELRLRYKPFIFFGVYSTHDDYTNADYRCGGASIYEAIGMADHLKHRILADRENA